MQLSLTVQKETIAGVFDRSARGYGSLPYFPVFGQRLVDALRIRSGENVLDVACGRGAILLPAAQKAGRQGKVIGIDLSAEMVEETNVALLAQGMKNAIALQMDAEDMQFSDSVFDHVLCGFALPFFPNLEEALAEILRVLKPGGNLAVSTWGTDDDRWQWYDEQRLAYGAAVGLTSQPLDRVEELADRLWRAGFAEVIAWKETYDWVCADEEQWWSAIWSISGRAALERLFPSALERFKAEAFQKMQALREPDGFHHLLQANFATGIKPY